MKTVRFPAEMGGFNLSERGGFYKNCCHNLKRLWPLAQRANVSHEDTLQRNPHGFTFLPDEAHNPIYWIYQLYWFCLESRRFGGVM